MDFTLSYFKELVARHFTPCAQQFQEYVTYHIYGVRMEKKCCSIVHQPSQPNPHDLELLIRLF